jgi:hypothetical protein
MRRTWIALTLAVAVLTCGMVGAIDDPKYTTKQVMKMAHAGGQNSLLAKVRSGKANKQDKEKLVELYEALAGNKPPKGDADAFSKLCEAMVDAAKAAQKGDKSAGQLLAKSTNCMACHNNHKP